MWKAWLAAAASLALGCGPILPYRPGFLLTEPVVQPGKSAGAATARRVGCLDVRVALACNATVPRDFPIVAFTLGNRCDTPVPVDLTRLRVTGKTQEAGGTAGAEEPLARFDLGGETHPTVLGPKAMAVAVFEYAATPPEATRAVTQVCVDLGGLSTDGEAGAPGASPACVTRPPDACPATDGLIRAPPPAPVVVKRPFRPLPLFVDVAAVAQTVDVGAMTLSDTAADSHAFSVHSPALGTAVVYGIDLRAGFRVAGPLYVGLTTRFAFGALSEHAAAVADGANVDLGGGLGAVAAGGLVGFVQPLSPGVRLRVDASVGIEDIGLLAISGIACAEGTCGPDSLRAWLEPRVAMDLWLDRSWSIAPFAGDDVLHPSSFSLGLMASWHWQPFDGMR